MTQGPDDKQVTLTATLAGWAAKLRYEDLPERVAQIATSQLMSQVAVVRAGMAHPLGRTLMRGFGSPGKLTPRAPPMSWRVCPRASITRTACTSGTCPTRR